MFPAVVLFIPTWNPKWDDAHPLNGHMNGGLLKHVETATFGTKNHKTDLNMKVLTIPNVGATSKVPAARGVHFSAEKM